MPQTPNLNTDPGLEVSKASALRNLVDEGAFLFEKHRALLYASGCGAAMGWVTYSACVNFQTPLSMLAIPLALAVTVLAVLNVWCSALIAVAIWTVQMLQFQVELGCVVAVLGVIFILLCIFGHGRASVVLITPYLSGWGLGIVPPLGLGLALGRKSGWAWAGMAFIWNALYAFLYGNWRLGVPANRQFLEQIFQRASSQPKGFTLEWLRYLFVHLGFGPFEAEAYNFIAQGTRWTALVIQLALWSGVAFMVGTFYIRKRELDKTALEYLAKATGSSMRSTREPLHRKLHGATAAGALALIVLYLILSLVFVDIHYQPIPEAVMDLVIAGVLLGGFYVVFEGHADRGRRAKGRRMAERAGLIRKEGQVATAGTTQSRAAGAIGTSNIATDALKREVKSAPRLPRRDLERTPSRAYSGAGAASQVSTPSSSRLRSWSPGEKIDNQYTVVREHIGGMGVVYEVVDEFSGKKYAVKSLKDDLLENEEAIERFGMEAKTWINLDHHENIVQAMLFRVVEGRPLLFLEFINGTDLEHLQKLQGSFSVAQVLDWAKQMCQGLAYAHNKDVGGGRVGIIHRDLKPANILLTREGTIKITDFGLAKVADASTHLTRQATGLGTLAYMPPEQLEDARNVDKRADIYAYGAVLYELLTGTPPVTGESVANLTLSILTKMAAAPSHKNPAVPPVLDSIVMRCLEKDRQNRYGSFEEIAYELSQVVITPAMQVVEGQVLTPQSWTPPASSGVTSKPSSGPRRSAGLSTGGSGSVSTSIESVLFIDMVASTALGSKYGDDLALQLKERLANMVSVESRREKVLFQKGTGDGFMLTFPESLNAARAAMGIMRRIQQHNNDAPKTHVLNLRMGIHFGQVNIDSQGDRQGTSVNFAARIEDAKADQFHQTRLGIQKDELQEVNRILISEVVNDELKSLGGFRTRLVGYFDFQGIPGRHRIYELQWK